ncbi:MAG TPA: sialidase family protein [Acidobacteriota bacterium]|nr:sialidase family protein [Acidobacteriota bacterium]
MRKLLLVGLCFFLLQNQARAEVRELSSPAATHSKTPFLFATNQALYMTWIQETGKSHTLKFAKYDGKIWTQPSTIVSDVPLFVNWADFPSLYVLDGGMLVAHWLQQSGKGKYAYDVMISVSKDEGKTWSPGIRPHKDSAEGEHGFVSLIPAKSGFETIWLDSRKFNQKDLHSMGNEMQLMSSVYSNGAFASESVLDSRVCDCCQTAATMTENGPIVLYRDRSNAEIRDISYVRREGDKWTSPKTLHSDNWKIAACPVNGPAVSANGKDVIAAWFTASGDKPQVNVSISSDSGATFGKAIRIDSGNPSGRVDVKWLDQTTAIVSWLENKSNGGADIMVRKVKHGKVETPIVVSPASAARASGFPRLGVWGKGAVIAWTYVGDNSTSVKLALIP